MEGKKISVKPITVMLIITVLVLGMFVEKNEAAFAGCFAECLALCVIHPYIKIGGCPLKCFKSCHHPPASDNDLNYYCKLGENEVEGCVNSCSGECELKH
ncbi:hypothetical protein BVC80_9063g107 [Macleaya cordata]|uniref:Thionin-like protein n=1 Tax=Macleaya cordata TaxID=56857 RepID=A0A200PNE7_MACCD|nr:hypothetical protein BVC80_9063g107 [Macleaya cordata]